jgi:Xaa-Pro aminopeptidase
VLLFWNSQAAEDRAVRAALRGIDRWGGHVFVKVAPISGIAKYGRIARGVDVQQSPTVVVVDRKLAATALVGYVDRQSIDQAVLDALRNSGGIYTSAYLRKVNDVCASTSRALFASPDPNSAAETPRMLKREVTLRTAFISDLRAIKAPARFAAFKAATVADAVAMRDVWAQFGRQAGANPSAATLAGSAAAADKRLTPISKRFNARMDKRHVLSCGSNG